MRELPSLVRESRDTNLCCCFWLASAPLCVSVVGWGSVVPVWRYLVAPAVKWTVVVDCVFYERRVGRICVLDRRSRETCCVLMSLLGSVGCFCDVVLFGSGGGTVDYCGWMCCAGCKALKGLALLVDRSKNTDMCWYRWLTSPSLWVFCV